ncbi:MULTISPECIES: TauD/TfdA family dioxygenase [unclassified Parafrankia]|uniref:TauD/TfdA dioxygenase family protein n=1 Tax=unclassified Parafrankia TaxID=2994368 RepID=UPI000DA5026A|nr:MULTISPECIES: TauD/TfdA family dioxygenase [unclassified Parafrankia]TCJ32919.1 TauD/TfdA family dioxygenase [Parafrankia sp. BMG5.11]CAI7974423.1 TauD/TfdA family dioxygenase [Frankia sp. Hr75.2]SQD95002.1 Taurine catabolism dioxygenase TauD/TfdA [Parafrankia sp. Ea1.12]
MGTTTRKITENTGTEFRGLKGTQLVDKGVADDALAALEETGVVVFSEADIDDEDLVAFARLLGNVLPLPMGGHKLKEIQRITRDASASKLAAYREATFHWHIDGTTGEVPDKATLLTARQISGDPEGDTEFANTYAAYKALSDEEKAQLEGVRALHSFTASQLVAIPNPSPEERAAWDRNPTREQPIVWTRGNGRKSLLVGSTAGEVVGLPADEGRALLDRLLAWATQPQFVLRHHWTQGDLVIWDNTGMLHRALPYGPSSSRLMHRASLAGEEAVA